MMMAIRANKRDRLIMSTHEDQDEYERAVAFLQEFHSRRVAAALHSTSLDAILEGNHLDEMLASDFSLAISVGRHGSLSTNDPSKSKKSTDVKKEGLVLQPIKNGGYAANRMRSPGTLSTMKKTATSKCLLDLDVTSASASDTKTPSSRCGLYSHQESSLDPEATDYYLGYDEQSSPMAKRRRSHGH